MNDKHLREIIQRLPEFKDSAHFRVFYGLRNPPAGPGLGAHGVAEHRYVQMHLHFLERLYSTLTAAPWSRPAPVVDPTTGKIHVYIFDISELIASDGSPLTGATLHGVPFICLPARSFEPSIQAELHRAAAEAVHEATHVFNYTERPLGSAHGGAWEWVDEAIAVYLETCLLAGNHDHFRFLKNWVDMPEVPLDDWAARYQAGLFACYLEKRVEPGLLNRVWRDQENAPAETPLETLQRLLPATRPLAAHQPHIRDVFASGYCLDSYFLWDHRNDWLIPDLFARFGERAVTESFQVRPAQQAQSQCWSLDHLACRYFRFYLPRGVHQLQIEVHSASDTPIAPLKAELAVVNPAGHKGDVIPLTPSPHMPEARRLAAELCDLPRDLDHLVLVVSNCGLRAAQVQQDIPHDDQRRFSICISAA